MLEREISGEAPKGRRAPKQLVRLIELRCLPAFSASYAMKRAPSPSRPPSPTNGRDEPLLVLNIRDLYPRRPLRGIDQPRRSAKPICAARILSSASGDVRGQRWLDSKTSIAAPAMCPFVINTLITRALQNSFRVDDGPARRIDQPGWLLFSAVRWPPPGRASGCFQTKSLSRCRRVLITGPDSRLRRLLWRVSSGAGVLPRAAFCDSFQRRPDPRDL
ncbi:MAG: hypothetical protein Udaeo2_21440 [Candidatus Udaeobacter sp.]|nr:MAG: hypothetical protein Udaeo2_21440 [Candidatus Udaeobacter sp.]